MNIKPSLLRALAAVATLLLLAPVARAQSAAVRSGDQVEIRLAGVPPEEISSFSALYSIDENGMLNLPYIGLIKVAGSHANQIQRTIEEKLKSDKIYTHPTVTVLIQTSMRLVNVGGPGIRSPQRVTYTPDLTLMSAINAAGGFSDYADRKRVSLIREGKAAVYDIRQFLKDPSLDPKVKPGDQINVPMSLF